MDDPKLPGSYGKTRLVLLVVDPYLIHAYWEVAPERLREAIEPAEQNKGVLRFYKGSETSGKGTQRESFDIEIDLQSSNWYVHLWSPEESLYADLSVKRSDGTLIRLIRSQVVHIPRTRPAVAIDQHFMKVEATERRAEIVSAPPPSAQHHRPPEGMAIPSNELHAPPVAKPIDSTQIVRETLKEAYASVQWRRSRSEPETVRAFSTPPPARAVADLTSIAEAKLAAGLFSGVLQKNRIEVGTD
jgi:hypothetical protein